MKTIGNSNRIQPAYTVGNAPTNNVAYTDLANAFTLAQSISLATAGTIFSLITTENNATAQAVDLYRHRAGAAGQDGDDLTELQFNGLDDNGTPQKTKYARILAEIADASDTTEDGRLSLGTMRAGSVVDWQVESGTLRYQGLTLPTTAGAINAVEFQRSGIPIAGSASFSADKNDIDQTSVSGSSVATKITFPNENWDVGGNYASSTFTAPWAGKFTANAQIAWGTTNLTANELLQIQLTQNGVGIRAGAIRAPSTSTIQVCSLTIDVDAALNDTFEIYATKSGPGAGTILGSTPYTWFQIKSA
mgnify:CR=1 FL=1